MIDRLAALADIVPPRPVAPVHASAGWHIAAGRWLPALLLSGVFVLGLALAALGARRLRRAFARRRLSRLRAGPPDAPIARLLPRVLDDLRRAGLPEPGAGEPAWRLHQRLLYGREAHALLLREYLERRLGP
jgi:hypothetical protein